MARLLRDRRIAVTGLAGAGKTVFLLSFLQHMEHFNSTRFHIAGNNARIGAFRELFADRDDRVPVFPRARLRAKLIASQNIAWPEKTGSVHRFRCAFDYSNLGFGARFVNSLARGTWMSRRVHWEFLDFPGERFADALIARSGSFPAWSDSLLDVWEVSEPLRKAMNGYLSPLAGSFSVSEKEILLSYKRCLSIAAFGKNQLVTPSSFMLGPEDGSTPSPEALRAGGADRLSGLPGGEFAPLPRDFRDARPDLNEIFSRNYSRYREKSALPIFGAVNGCDTLLVVVDIPGILSGGVGRYNDASHLLETLADNVSPSGWFSGGVGRLALIAAKADMIHLRDQDSLMALAEDMLRLIRNRRPEIDRTAAFPVSAWVSAESLVLEDGSRALRGIPARGGDGVEKVFRVPELKAEWPDDWEAEDAAYSYPRLSPPRLANRFTAPKQWNLEKVFDFIIS